MELLEGNWSQNFKGDSYWGNSIDITVFRNWLTGLRSANGFLSTYKSVQGNCTYLYGDYDGRSNVDVQAYSFNQNFVGNVLGMQGQVLLGYNSNSCFDSTEHGFVYENTNNSVTDNRYVAWNIGSLQKPNGWDWVPNTYTTTLRDGNFDWISGKSPWLGIGGAGTANIVTPQAIPNSLYLSSKPAFFGSNPWPWVDPTTGNTSILPAKYCFNQGQMPNCLQSGGTPSPTVTLTANPTSITSGQSSTLTWSSTNATSCSGVNFSPSGTSGSSSVSPTITTTYSLTCTGAGGSSSGSATVTVGTSGDTQAPTVPTNLSATAVSSSAINLTWTASTDNVAVTGYQVFRNGTQVSTPATNSYSDTGLAAATSYSYTVKATDAAGNVSATSSAASATTQTGLTVTVTAPTGQLAAGTTQTTLSVTTSVNATCAWSNTSGLAFASMTTFTTTGGSSHSTTLSGLTNGTSYTTYVKCKDTLGNISADSSTSYSVASAGGGGGPITVGKTTTAGWANSGDANLLIAYQVTLSQTATIQSLSFYVLGAAGTQRLGVYDATGASGGPGTLKAQTNSYTPIVGWNTVPVITPVSLPAGTYYLAYLNSDNNLSYPTEYANPPFYAGTFTYGPLPTTFPAVTISGGATWSFYGTLSVP
jgi:hypothetical protein